MQRQRSYIEWAMPRYKDQINKTRPTRMRKASLLRLADALMYVTSVEPSAHSDELVGVSDGS